MTARSRFVRFLIGFGLVLGILVIGFTLANALIPTYGTTPAEQALSLPGDGLLPSPQVSWNHAETINAAPGEVWPWIAQMGDSRGGFYSYTWIEHLVDATPGMYVNADRIHPEWQNPPTGQGLISTMMRVSEFKAGDYMLAATNASDNSGMGWTWVWKISPTADGKTRLNIHMRIQVAGMSGALNAVFTSFMNLGAFIMERNLMSGLKLRAEGGFEPVWIEAVEIVLWLAALGIGLAAAFRFVARPNAQRALYVGLIAVVVLQVFTFLQPEVWLRGVIDLALLGGLVWAWQGGQVGEQVVGAAVKA